MTNIIDINEFKNKLSKKIPDYSDEEIPLEFSDDDIERYSQPEIFFDNLLDDLEKFYTFHCGEIPIVTHLAVDLLIGSILKQYEIDDRTVEVVNLINEAFFEEETDDTV